MLRKSARFGGIDEPHERLDEPLRVLAMGKVPGVVEDLETAPRDRAVGIGRVAHGDDPVARAPHDQGRHVGGEIESIGRADGLRPLV